jgi:hypothetical protein
MTTETIAEIGIRLFITAIPAYAAYIFGWGRGFDKGFKLAEELWKPRWIRSLHEQIWGSEKKRPEDKPQ